MIPLRKAAALGVLVALTLLTLPAAAQPGKQRPLTVEDLWKVQRPGKPALSPDGQWVAVEVTTYSMEDNDSTSELWLLSTDGKTQKQLTARGGKVSSPVWSPDGGKIAFVLSTKDKAAQIYTIEPQGGEARQLSKLPMAPSGLKWGRDGKTIYCVVRTWHDTPDDESYRKREKEKKEAKVQAYVIDDAMFRYWDAWVADGKRPVVFAVDAATGKHRNLFAGTKLHLPVPEASANQYDVAPDGKELCFVADSAKEFGSDFNLDLYVMPLDKSGAPKNLTPDNEAHDNQPVYTPDGKAILFLRQKTKYFYADQQRLMRHDRASGKNTPVFAHFERSINTPRCADAAGERIIFEAEHNGYHMLFAGDTTTNQVTFLTKKWSDSNFDLAPSPKGDTIAFLRSSFDLPAAVCAIVPGDNKPRQIERFNAALVSQWKLGKVEEVFFKGADDDDVQMWIVYPPDFDAKKKWPLLQVVHGGPHNGITTDFHFRWNLQLMAARGYVVSCINFHGSSGFGHKFTDSITGDLATKPFTDIMKGTDYMEKQPYIDKDRMVAAGASYGGYMMAWMNGHTDRFKAMVCHAGVYNWHSMMASDIVKGRDRALGANAWGDLSQIDKQSPQRYAANFKTPTLVTHGEKDYRVPLTQGFEYFTTLKLKGVPARLVYFPDENHWVLRPQNSRLWHQEFFGWLDKYVGHGPSK
jgi:dipeptidyl aminopeptidase/acylaminoacyl peptidase